MAFQKQVGIQPVIGVPGDFASSNPRFTVDAGPGGLVAGNNLFAGRFAWTTPPLDPDGTAQVANCNGSGPVTGFVHREQTGSIFYPSALGSTQQITASMQLLPGYICTLMNGGDFLVANSGATAAQVGQKAYANLTTGLVSFAATGSPSVGGTSTASTIAAATASVTGSIANNIMTVTAVGSGSLYNGSVLSGTGVATGTQIVSQISGTPKGVGTYYVSIPNQTAASTTISTTYGLLTIGGTVTGTFSVGDPITGASAGTVITDQITGVGQAGTYAVNNTQTVGSGAINAQSTVETKWVAMSAGAPGEIVKISDHVLG